MTSDKVLNTNRNGIYSVPGVKYPAIKLKDGFIAINPIRTRNVWNDLRGGFVSFNQFVIDIQQEYYCPNCGKRELLWSSDFTKDNEYLISCDYCKELTFLKSFWDQPDQLQETDTSDLLTMIYDTVFAEFSPEYRKFPISKVKYSELDEDYGIYFEFENNGYVLKIEKQEA